MPVELNKDRQYSNSSSLFSPEIANIKLLEIHSVIFVRLGSVSTLKNKKVSK